MNKIIVAMALAGLLGPAAAPAAGGQEVVE